MPWKILQQNNIRGARAACTNEQAVIKELRSNNYMKLPTTDSIGILVFEVRFNKATEGYNKKIANYTSESVTWHWLL